MEKRHQIPRELEWRGYGNFANFQDTDAKISQHEATLADLPSSVEALIGRARQIYALAGLYWAKHDNESALKYSLQAIELAERLQDSRFQSWCHNLMGDVFVDMGDYDAAVVSFQRAITCDKTSAYAHLGLGCVYSDLLNCSQEAIAAYQRALDLGGLNPHLVSIVQNGLGNVHYALGQEEEAIAAYQRAVHADPGYLSPHDNLGLIAMKRGEFAEARSHLEKRIHLRPQHSLGAYVSMGIMSRHEGNPDYAIYFRQALDSFEAAWKARYDTPAGFLENKALALIGLGKSQEALETIKEMLSQRAPGDALELFRFEMLRTAPDPSEGVEKIIELLRSLEG